jgi:hypothetical protein
MDPESSLPSSQGPSTGPYSEPDQSSPHHPILFLLTFILTLLSHLHLGFHSGLLPSRFPTKTLYAFLFSPTFATCAAHLIFLGLLILIKNINYDAPHYAIFSNLLLCHPSSVQIFSSAPCSQVPSVYVLVLTSETKFHTHTKLQAKL